MSRRLKQLSGRDVAAILVRFGFDVVATRGSLCKLRRTLPSGERQTITIPLHVSLATGTLHAIYRQAARFVAEKDLQPHFYSDDAPSGAKQPAPKEAGSQSVNAGDRRAHRRSRKK
jgi:predicted RNA binding protein YcfA (HicA-like mRNA interferase family)